VLDQAGRAVGAKLLRDEHWLVRGLALRMLADQYRERVGNVLERYAKDDPEQWVRRMAAALLARMRASSRPAG
jgi:HEAT repeat protein